MKRAFDSRKEWPHPAGQRRPGQGLVYERVAIRPRLFVQCAHQVTIRDALGGKVASEPGEVARPAAEVLTGDHGPGARRIRVLAISVPARVRREHLLDEAELGQEGLVLVEAGELGLVSTGTVERFA